MVSEPVAPNSAATVLPFSVSLFRLASSLNDGYSATMMNA